MSRSTFLLYLFTLFAGSPASAQSTTLDRVAQDVGTSVLEFDNWGLTEAMENLHSDDYRVRILACKRLGKLRELARPAVPDLIQLLNDPRLREFAIPALGSIGDMRAFQPLMEIVMRPQASPNSPFGENPQKDAALALAELGTDVVAALVRALQTETTRAPAAYTLQIIGGAHGDISLAVDPLIAILLQCLKEGTTEAKDLASSAMYALAESKDERAVAPLVAALQNDDSLVVFQAAGALDILRHPASIPMLVNALETGNRIVRREVARALASGWSGRRGIASLLRVAKDPEPEVRQYVMDALGSSEDPDPSIFEALRHALEDEDSEVRRRATDALGRRIDPRTINPLLDALRDHDPLIRESAAQALKKKKKDDPRVLDALISAMTDTVSKVRRAVVMAIDPRDDWGIPSAKEIPRVLEPLINALSDDDYSVSSPAVTVLQSGGFRGLATPYLIRLLASEKTRVREYAAKLLGEIGDSSAVVALSRVLTRDQESLVRAHAATALGRLKDPRGGQPLTAATGDTDDGVRESAVRALGELAHPGSIATLCTALSDKNYQIRISAIAALGTKGESSSLECLLKALKDPKVIVRLNAAHILGGLGNARAIEPLIASLEDSYTYADPEPNEPGYSHVELVLTWRHETAGSLRMLTEKNFDLDAKAWRAWWTSTKHETAPRR